MFLNGRAILYLFHRLSPFLIVSYFILNSILLLDYKGLIYIAGLLLASCVAKLGENLFDSLETKHPIDTSDKCNLYTLGVSQNGYMNEPRFSKIPLSLVVFSYSLSYILVFIITSNLVSVNSITIIFFCYLICMEFLFLRTNECSNVVNCLFGIVIGGAIGTIWAFIIKSSNNTNLYYYNGINNGSYCTIAKERKYKCTMNP